CSSIDRKVEFSVQFMIHQVFEQPFVFDPSVRNSAKMGVTRQIVHSIDIQFGTYDLRKQRANVDVIYDKEIVRRFYPWIDKARDMQWMNIAKVVFQNFAKRGIGYKLNRVVF